jgi:hypothetical protein
MPLEKVMRVVEDGLDNTQTDESADEGPEPDDVFWLLFGLAGAIAKKVGYPPR